MNDKFLLLLCSELKKQAQVNSLIKYLFLYFAFCILSITFVSDYKEIQEFGIVFSVITIPLAMLNLANALLREDAKDGTIESQLTVFSAGEIICSKFLVLFLCANLAYGAIIPIIYLLYDIETNKLILTIVCSVTLIGSCSSLMCLISSVQCFFRSNTNFLTVLIMPLIIPSIILIGMAMQTEDHGNLVGILFGINLIMIPLGVYLSTFLIANIYET